MESYRQMRIRSREDGGKKEAEDAMKKMKSGKATGCSGIPVDLLKHLGKEGIRMVTSLLQKVWDEEKMQAEWELSELVPIYKRKGDPLDCGNFRGISLLEHVMKILEKVIGGRLRGLVSINDMQFGFSRDEFTIGVGLLSPFLFIVVQDVISEKFQTGLSWELLFADSEKELQRRWLRWQIGMESKVLKVNTKKTEVLASSRRGVDKDNARLSRSRSSNTLE
ncbi:uncharacterized protein LOC125038030 [Penaeus chinensis]|uniref:uncharacterized protein LOC125038030 n=1 Tax=Penaeus chinensis TaxID=139456 RepID=UPI001FB7381C|nr:uncharacterized protein LOC125038030 [Penaeus chinensis]